MINTTSITDINQYSTNYLTQLKQMKDRPEIIPIIIECESELAELIFQYKLCLTYHPDSDIFFRLMNTKLCAPTIPELRFENKFESGQNKLKISEWKFPESSPIESVHDCEILSKTFDYSNIQSIRDHLAQIAASNAKSGSFWARQQLDR